MFGRSRRLPDIDSTSSGLRSFSQRVAVNTPVQGTAADIIKLAMLKVHGALRDAGMQTRMILQVHDELIFECPAEEVDAVRELASRIMPASLEMNVPLKVDLKQGKNWSDMK